MKIQGKVKNPLTPIPGRGAYGTGRQGKEVPKTLYLLGTPWDHLGPLGTTWDHLGPLGPAWAVGRVGFIN